MFHQFLKANRFSPIQFSPSINAGGRQTLIELSGCNRVILNSQEQIFEIMKDCIDAMGDTVVNQVFHQFHPQGVKGVLLLEEGHCSIHTWPEQQRASIDFYTDCDKNPGICEKLFMALLEADKCESVLIDRTEGLKVQSEVSTLYFPSAERLNISTSSLS